MKISECENLLEKTVDEAYELWVNGNLTVTISIIKSLPSFAVATVVVEVAHRLDKDSRQMFLRRIQSEAVSELFFLGR